MNLAPSPTISAEFKVSKAKLRMQVCLMKESLIPKKFSLKSQNFTVMSVILAKII